MISSTLASAPFATVFASALRGEPCTVSGMTLTPRVLEVDQWLGDADLSDRAVLAHCVGPTIDIGCGPGRMCAHLARQGRLALGIDVVAEAVEAARERGAIAVRRDVFGPVPGEGRWGSALLADGNIGIGGDPVVLLGRVGQILAPGGRAVVDLSPPGAGLQQHEVRLQTSAGRTRSFGWAVVGVDVIGSIARAARFVVSGLYVYDERWFGVLTKEP